MSTMWLWKAFEELHAGRGGGFGPAGILKSEVVAYCEIEGYDFEERKWVACCVSRMDDVWMQWAREQK